MNDKSRINELKTSIHHHGRKYYIDCEPDISDYDYDMLFKELKDLEKANPDLVTADSPTQIMFKGKW